MILKDIDGFVPYYRRPLSYRKPLCRSLCVRKFFDTNNTVDYNDGFSDGVLFVMDELYHVPTVDAVPVVRCGECEHSFVLEKSPLATEPPYKYYRKDCVMCGCEELVGDYPIVVTDTFYCGYGERG